MTHPGLAGSASLSTALLLGMACGSLPRLRAPVEFHASPIERERPGSARVEVTLRFDGPAPLELDATLTHTDGDEAELDCSASRHATLCGGATGGIGTSRVTVNYRAVDERLESVTLDLQLHGDEEEIVVSGAFDDDASLPRLVASIYRAAGPRIALETVELRELGQLPFFKLSNESETDIVTWTHTGFLLGYIVRVAEEGTWEQVPGVSAGCGSGLGLSSIPPGTGALGLASAGAGVPLSNGSYLYVVEFDDAETQELAHVSRRITASFEVRGVPDVEADRRFAIWAFDWQAPDLWADAMPPTRPGLERPSGREGSRGFEGTPLLADGEDIAGVLSTERSRHTYRLDLTPWQQGVVRIYARCTETPCSATVGMYAGDEEDFGGESRTLHRESPAWSFREAIVRDDDDVFVIGCREECDAGWEFYGRVHVRDIPKSER